MKSKWNGHVKWFVSTAIMILLIVAGWASTATSMKKDIESNREKITDIKDDLREIKTDVKELLKR